jgi:hypothetical protein
MFRIDLGVDVRDMQVTTEKTNVPRNSNMWNLSRYFVKMTIYRYTVSFDVEHYKKMQDEIKKLNIMLTHAFSDTGGSSSWWELT